MVEPVCSSVSLGQAEPLQATASIVRNWVLVEQPGAWGPQAVSQSGLPAHVAERLVAEARARAFRVLLIRRPERPSDGSRHCFVAHSGRRARWIEERVVSDLDELLDVDFSPLREGRPPAFGPRRDRPLYLVCTNGRHDPCCATLGRPVARALQGGAASDSVWECSHFGGDRFAGNLVCLPHGLYFGRLEPSDASRVVEGYERGTIDLDHYRGRAGDPFAVQAAEFYVRRQERLVGIEDLSWVSHRHLGNGHDAVGDVVEVTLAGPGGGVYDVRVGVVPAPDPRRLTCHTRTDEQPPTYALLKMNRR